MPYREKLRRDARERYMTEVVTRNIDTYDQRKQQEL